MRLSTQLLWLASVSVLFCAVSSFAIRETTAGESVAGKGEEEEGEGEEGSHQEEGEDDEGDNFEGTEPTFEFDDFVDLDALARGVLGKEDGKNSVVPCFGTWWPSNGGYGGYVYYYEDYGTDYGDGGGTTDEGAGDYGRRRRGRRSRNRRTRKRTKRNRSMRSRKARKAAKKKS